MAWLCVSPNNEEELHTLKPIRIFEDEDTKFWLTGGYKSKCIILPPGSILKLLGYTLTFKDDPVEI